MNCLNFGTLILAFEYNMGSSGLDGSPLLIYGFHVTEHLRAVADQKRVLYWSAAQSMEILLEPNQIRTQ